MFVMYMRLTNMNDRKCLYNLSNISHFEDVENCYNGPNKEAKTCIHTLDDKSMLVKESLSKIQNLMAEGVITGKP